MEKRLACKIENIWHSWQKLSVIEDLYSNTNGHVINGDCISDNFEIDLGVKQGDPPSPFFFNVYMDELCLNLIQMGKDALHNQFHKIPMPFLGR